MSKKGKYMLNKKIAMMLLVSCFAMGSTIVSAYFKKSDKSIQKEIHRAIKRDPSLDDDGMSVLVKDAYVTLEGTVDNESERDLAQKLAGNVQGVKKVNNRLAIERKRNAPNNGYYQASNAIKTDKEIYDDIERRLYMSPELNSNKIRTSVRNGKVTFTGTVNEGSDLNLVNRKAREAGAVKVVNLLEVISSQHNRY